MKRLMTFVAALALLVPSWCGAVLIAEVEANNSLATAQIVDAHFSLDFSPDIGNGTHVDNTSTTIPHVTIRGSGDGTFDYYSFFFPGPGSTSGFVVLDIDYPSSSFDSHIALWAADGTLLGHNDDYDFRGGAGGSVANRGNDSYDSLMTAFLTTPGTYIVGVARWGAGFGPSGYIGGFVDAEPQTGDLYTLQISVEGMPTVPVPEPSTFALLAAGAIAVTGFALRRRKA